MELSIRQGRCLEKTKDFKEAEKTYEEATKQNPENSQAFLRLGWIQIRQGKKEEGIGNL